MKILLSLIIIFTFAQSESYGAEFNESHGVVASDLDEYCDMLTQASYLMFLGRNSGMPKQEMIDMQQGLTDPKALAMIDDTINYAFMQPADTTIKELQEGFKSECLLGELNHQGMYSIYEQ